MSETRQTTGIFLRPLVQMLRRSGEDAEGILRAHGVEPAMVANPEARVDAECTSRLLDQAVLLLDDPSLGINMARHSEYSTFGGLGLALAAGGNLRSVLNRIVRFHRLISDVVVSELVEDEAGLGLHMRAATDHQPHPQAILFVMASIMGMLRFRIRRDLNPVALMAPAVDDTVCVAMTRYFRTAVTPADHFALLFSRDEADAQLEASDPQLAAMLDATLTQRLVEADRGSLAMQLSIWLEERLPEGEPSLAEAANRLHMSVRSLQRRLGDENLTWKQLLEKTRRLLVERHLQAPNMSITQLAFLLGFSDVSSFSRAFKKWYGVAPSHYRDGSD